MEGVQEAAGGAAQTVLDSVAADAAAFPWLAGVIAWLVATIIMWSVVEVIKATAVSRLKRRPSKKASERTVVRRIARQWHWYPLVIWGVSLVGGAAIGFGVGSIDGFGDGDLGWWGLAFGAVAGVLNGCWMKLLRGAGDKLSNLLLGWAKRRLGADDKAEG